jgi:hypothetical protein
MLIPALASSVYYGIGHTHIPHLSHVRQAGIAAGWRIFN